MNKLHKKDYFLWSINTALEAHADNNLAIIGTSCCEQQVFMKKLTLTSINLFPMPSILFFCLFIYSYFLIIVFPLACFPLFPLLTL